MPPSPSRRDLLLTAGTSALVALAGCATTGPASSPTRTATDLPDRTPAFPEGPKDPPSRPAELTEQSAGDYVEAYHYRYVYNRLWMGPTTIVHLDCTVERVEAVGIGFRVVVSCTGWSESNEAHADHFTQRYEYLIDEDSLVRRHLAVGSATPPTPTR